MFVSLSWVLIKDPLGGFYNNIAMVEKYGEFHTRKGNLCMVRLIPPRRFKKKTLACRVPLSNSNQNPKIMFYLKGDIKN